MSKKDSADRTAPASSGQGGVATGPANLARLSIQVDFPVFAERTEERGSAGSINQTVCHSTDVLSVFARRGKLTGRRAVRTGREHRSRGELQSGRLTLS